MPQMVASYVSSRQFSEAAKRAEELQDKGLELWVKARTLENDFEEGFERELIELLEEAAKDGCVMAMNDLGEFYRRGIHGLEENRLTARKWYERSAILGDVEAMEKCVELYLGQRKELPARGDKAYFWFTEALEYSSEKIQAFQKHHEELGTWDLSTTDFEAAFLKAFEEGLLSGGMSCLDIAEMAEEGDTLPLYALCHHVCFGAGKGPAPRTFLGSDDPLEEPDIAVALLGEMQTTPEAGVFFCYWSSFGDVAPLEDCEEEAFEIGLGVVSSRGIKEFPGVTTLDYLKVLQRSMKGEDVSSIEIFRDFGDITENPYEPFREQLVLELAACGSNVAAGEIIESGVEVEIVIEDEDPSVYIATPERWEKFSRILEYYRRGMEAGEADSAAFYAGILFLHADAEPGISDTAEALRIKEGLDMLMEEVDKGSSMAAWTLATHPEIVGDLLDQDAVVSLLEKILPILSGESNEMAPGENKEVRVEVLLALGTIYGSRHDPRGRRLLSLAKTHRVEMGLDTTLVDSALQAFYRTSTPMYLVKG